MSMVAAAASEGNDERPLASTSSPTAALDAAGLEDVVVKPGH
jgi:hypothetical protein